jgi:hypothetical protein
MRKSENGTLVFFEKAMMTKTNISDNNSSDRLCTKIVLIKAEYFENSHGKKYV